MRKFAIGILSLFVLFGGLLLTACGEKVSLSVKDTSTIVLFTNKDENNSDQKVVDVTLKNSSEGVGISVISGVECISVPSRATNNGNGNYSFVVSAVSFGDAQIRVYAIEDASKSQVLNIKVNTLLDKVNVGANSLNENKYVVKEGTSKLLGNNFVGKELIAEDYFDLEPTSANIRDIDWTFDSAANPAVNPDNPKEVLLGEDVVAEIVAEGSTQRLYVYQGFSYSNIKLKATVVDKPNVFNMVELDVLENVKFTNFYITGTYAYNKIEGEAVKKQEGYGQLDLLNNLGSVVENQEDITFELRRSTSGEEADKFLTKIEGGLSIKTQHKIDVEPVFYKIENGQYKLLPRYNTQDEEGYETYFNVQTTYQQNEGSVDVTFVIDANDTSNYRKFGDFLLAFKAQYRDYAYAVSTENVVDVSLSTRYYPTQIELSNGEQTLNNGKIDVYSSYVGTFGYKLQAKILPDDVVIGSKSGYFISIQAEQDGIKSFRPANDDYTSELSKVLKFYQNNKQIENFTFDGTYYKSPDLQNGSDVYICAGDDFGNDLKNFQINFVACSNEKARTTLNLDLYKIFTATDTFDVSNMENGEPPEVMPEKFVVSSQTAIEKEFNLRIYGISQINGLTLEHDDDSRFSFSNFRQIRNGLEGDSVYVDVAFKLKLRQSKFEGTTEFWFNHITNRTSNHFLIEAFVPMTSATVTNKDTNSSSVHIQTNDIQNYYIDGVEIKTGEIGNETLTKLVLEAGSNVTLRLDYQTLSSPDAGIGFYFVNLDGFAAYLSTKGLDEGLAKQYAANIFNDPTTASLSKLISDARYADIFGKSFNAYVNNEDFSVTKINDFEYRLSVFPEKFIKYFIAAKFDGFDEQHNPRSFVRIFTVESLYSVQFVSPNVSSVALYSSETLSESDMGRASTNVSVSFRADGLSPTYLDFENIRIFSDETLYEVKNGQKTNVSSDKLVLTQTTILMNDFYQLDSFLLSENRLSFRIMANSTKDLSTVFDTFTIKYSRASTYKPNGEYDGNVDDVVYNEVSRQAEIQVQVLNEVRIEKVIWQNRTATGDIYLNATQSALPTEKNFTITTLTSPAGAGNGLKTISKLTNLSVSEISKGQTFGLKIGGNGTTGGTGFIYIVPNDMIKLVGSERLLVYRYDRDEDDNIKENNGRRAETAVYISTTEIEEFYQFIQTCEEKGVEYAQFGDYGEIANFFFNNDNEKVYYRDIILRIRVTIADGSEQAPIRIYNENGLKRMLGGNHYQVMNDITVSAWQTFDSLSGSISAYIDENGNPYDVTITFADGAGNAVSGMFVRTLTGAIRNLTFAGHVSSSEANVGFVVGTNRGTIENVVVDVAYSSNTFGMSSLISKNTTADNVYTGGIVGENDFNAKILNSFVYGLDITASKGWAGGIAGRNLGLIEGCRFEFYNFAKQGEEIKTNKITNIGRTIGGIVGSAGENSQIVGSYVYSFPAIDNSSVEVLNGQYKGAFIGNVEGQDVEVKTRFPLVKESFAFVGTLFNAHNGTSGTVVKYENSYITFNHEGEQKTRVFLGTNEFDFKDFNNFTAENVLTKQDVTGNTEKWKNIIDGMDTNVWAIDGEGTINFGFVYLVKNTQSVPVDVNVLKVEKVTSSNENLIKALPAGNDKILLFNYKTTVTPSGEAKESELQTLNTIALTDLFGLSREEVSSLILMSNSKDIALTATSIQILRTNLTELDLTVYSKMNYSNSKTFKFVILNNLPVLYAEQNDVELRENQIILLQKGEKATQTVTYSFDERIYLGGDEYSTVQNDNYAIKFDNSSAKDYFQVSVNGQNLILKGTKVSGTPLSLSTWLAVTNVTDADYVKAIKDARKLTYKVSVYEGATDIVVVNSSALEIKASVHRTFDVVVKSDNTAEDIVINLWNNNLAVRVALNNTIDGIKRFEVDSKLSLDFTWTRKPQGDGSYLFKVSIKITDEKRHLVDEDYDNLMITVAPQSQQTNEKFIRQIALKVKRQQLETKDMTLYAVEDRQIVNSVLYLTPSNINTSTLSPSSEAILVVTASPAYALMTHFDLTYTATAIGNGRIGLVTFTRLMKNNNGYFTTSSDTTQIANGLRVNMTDEDKKGNGIYFFRVYVSGSFTTGSRIQLSLNFFNGETAIDEPCTSNVTISYLNSAEVSINGQSAYLLAKGESAQITVDVDEGQMISAFYLQNAGSGISKTELVQSEVLSDGRIRYTSTLSASVLATVVKNGQIVDNGIFYVYVSVERTLNGRREVKEDYVSVCLVDFALDGNSIALDGAAQNYTTMNINGKEEKVWNFYSYVDGSRNLKFNYPIHPEPDSINYNPNNSAEVEKVTQIRNNIRQFREDNSYEDKKANYYINYEYNSAYATYDKLDLWEGLYYVASNGNATAVYNRYQDTVLANDFFNIEKHDGESDTSPYFTIEGVRTGTQLMKLQTVVYYQGVRMSYDCYFMVHVEFRTDEDTPKPIYTADEFVDYLANSQDAGDYILMNDIVLNDYTPLNTDKVSSLDGNGYVIHINSFAKQEGITLNYALFNTVSEISTLKNLKVNIYNGGQIYVNIAGQRNLTVNAAGFAIENNGTIYNCEVVAYYEQGSQLHAENGDVGLVVRYTNGENGTPIQMQNGVVTSNVAGFVVTNNSAILNSRVGGEQIKHIYKVGGNENNLRIRSKSLDTFVVTGQGQVAGFVCTNAGNVSACFADKVQINNQILSNIARTAGFVLQNSGSVQSSYVEGKEYTEDGQKRVRNIGTNISSMGYVAGFVHTNSGLVKNSYANIAIDNTNNGASFVSGFVYINEGEGEITLCFSACEINESDTKQMPFSGRDDNENNLNSGLIDMCYYYETSATDAKKQMELGGIKPVDDNITRQQEVANIFYGFSFASGQNTSGEPNYDGIWRVADNGLALVSPNKIAFSNRYSVTNQEKETTSFFYNTNIIDEETMTRVDLSYGTEINPIIIRNAEEFAKATDDVTNPPISSYREFYTDTSVFGHYRLVNNLDMSEVKQDSTQTDTQNKLELRTYRKTFSGLLDGNGFTMLNINLGSSRDLENYGLFAKLYEACVMNLDLTVSSIRNTHANSVGALAGTAVNSRIIAITISPTESSSGSLDMTVINGLNTVGGVVGILMGDSQMIDVTAQNIEVRSSSSSNKTIYSNEAHVGTALRNLAQNQASLKDHISEISYAGAIAGYVDITKPVNNDYVKYKGSLKSSDCDIIKVHVSNSVNIYGEIVGGLFGYVGNSTYIYDAQLEIDASTSRATPSYIISKNLFAGGLIGENYGGLFAVGAKYTDNLSSQIESDEYAYYQGGAVTERGQETIFSLTESDPGSTNKSDDPLFIGGLVGYMGGGFINVGYSKLNVIGHSQQTVAVGGIVGAVGYSNTQYELAATSDNSIVNMFFQEVYASGDLYADGENDNPERGISGGLIGAVGVRYNEQTKAEVVPIVAIKKAMAMNYYSYSGQTLLGDNGVETSDKHFTLAGKSFKFDDVTASGEQAKDGESEYLKVKAMPGSAKFLIVDNSALTYDVVNNYGTSNGLNKSVGGYREISVAGNLIKLNPYGFKASFDGDNNQLIPAVHIGKISEKETQYSIFNSYFLENNWTNDIWKHDTDTPFPYVDLFETSTELFWDATKESTLEVLRKVANGEARTIVVRGKEAGDSNSYIDIDLTNGGRNLIGELKGADETEYNTLFGNSTDVPLPYIFNKFNNVTLISYRDYMEAVDSPVGILSGDNDSSVGGRKKGDKVGFILDKSMFNEISRSYINGINFYMTKNKTNEPKIDYRLVNSVVYGSTIFTNCRVAYNENVFLVPDESERTISLGLIANEFNSSSFIASTIELRNDATITLSAKPKSLDKVETNIYMGLIAGKIEKTGGFNSINIERLMLTQEGKSNICVVNFEVTGEATDLNVYAGLYAGLIDKTGSTSGINEGGVSIGLSNFSKNVKINILGETKFRRAYIGGFVGKATAVDEIIFSPIQTANGENVKREIDIYQKFETDYLYAGMGFGEVLSQAQLSNSTAQPFTLEGALHQVVEGTFKTVDGKEVFEKGEEAKTYTTGTAKIGGLIGSSTNGLTIRNISVDFSLSSINVEPDEQNKIKEQVYADEGDFFNENNEDYIEKTNSYVLGVNSAVGGFVGEVVGGSVIATSNCDISGNIDVVVDNKTSGVISIGGFFGTFNGGLTAGISSNNNMNISVRQQDMANTTNTTDTTKKITANVGGVIGLLKANENDSGAPTEAEFGVLINQGDDRNINVTGNVLSNVNVLKYGGAIGYIERTKVSISTNNVCVSRIVYGGAVRIYGKTINKGEISVGGVVGEFNSGGTEELNSVASALTENLSYGDVFVNYPFSSNETDTESGAKTTTFLNYTLKSYNFGGIVGGLPTNQKVYIGGNASIMTSFNDKLNIDEIANGENTYGNSYKVGAIAGKSADNGVYVGDFDGDDKNYGENAYSSIVALATQAQDGNVDYAYGTTTLNYLGYLTEGQLNKSITATPTDNILKMFTSLTDGLKDGHKLKPYLLSDDKPLKFKVNDDTKEYSVGENGVESFHNIHWIAINSNELTYNFSDDFAFADKFKNTVLVGNGQTIQINDSQNKTNLKPYGGFINTMGEPKKDDNTEELTFNVISGLVIQLNTEMDIDLTSAGAPTYGGVVGTTYGHSIIYGLGVEGDLSVGGTNATVKLGGIVGEMRGGMIAQSYFDANMTYRATDNGNISGIANLKDFNNTILSTYSSGNILSYVENNIYTFAKFEVELNASDNTNVIKDCYTVANAKVNDVLNNQPGSIYTIQTQTEDSEKKTIDNIKQDLVNASYSTSVRDFEIDEMAIGYGSENEAKYSLSFIKKGTNNTVDKWYFSQFTNNGYATHGFGFLKNVSTFTREDDTERIDTEIGDKEKIKIIKLYKYMEVPYIDILKNYSTDETGKKIYKYKDDKNLWFLAVANEGKLQQVLKAGEEGVYESNDLRFWLTNDLEMTRVGTTVLGKNVGTFENSYNFIFDGDNHTLDFEGLKGTTSLFGTVKGTIQNLRMVNVAMNSTGTLAATLNGNMNNIAVVGNLTANGNVAGGVVGTLVGSAEAVEGAVNVTNASGGRIIGGLVGVLKAADNDVKKQTTTDIYEKEYTGIYYSSNSGQVISSMGSSGDVTNPEPNPEGGDALLQTAITDYESGTKVATKNINLVAGGVVGYAGSGTNIENSYNANSVFTGYTQTTDGNYVGGGVVGYSNCATITSSYNVGMVISGNYGTETAITYYSDSKDGPVLSDATWDGEHYTFKDISAGKHYAYAGGIFGYGAGGEVSKCINDASVEALGEAPTQFIGKHIDGNLKEGFDKVPKIKEGYSVLESISDGSGYRIMFKSRKDSQSLNNLYMERKVGETDFHWAVKTGAKLTDVFDDLREINFVNGIGTEIYFEEAYRFSTMQFFYDWCSTMTSDGTTALRYLSDDEINVDYYKKIYGEGDTGKFGNKNAVLPTLNSLTPNFPDYADESGTIGGEDTLSNLNVKLYNYYNPGRAREVYAYGIGFMNAGTFSDNNYSSENNIKNDGCIGQVSDIGNTERNVGNKSIRDNTISFYRNTILGNKGLLENGKATDYSFVGKFNSDAQIHASGYDSYKLISRVYVEDTIQRRYANQAVNFYGSHNLKDTERSYKLYRLATYGYRRTNIQDYAAYFEGLALGNEGFWSLSGKTDIIGPAEFMFYGTIFSTENWEPGMQYNLKSYIPEIDGREYVKVDSERPYYWNSVSYKGKALVALPLPKWMNSLNDAYAETQNIEFHNPGIVYSDDQVYFDKISYNNGELSGKVINEDSGWNVLPKQVDDEDFDKSYGIKYGAKYDRGTTRNPLNVYTGESDWFDVSNLALRNLALDFNQTKPTVYTESAEFEDYDNILKDLVYDWKNAGTYYDTQDPVRGYTSNTKYKGKIGLVGFNLKESGCEVFNLDNVSEPEPLTDIQTKTNEIDLAREGKENFKAVKVNGKYVSIASTTKDLMSSYLPYVYNGHVEIDKKDITFLSGRKLSKSDIEIVGSNVGAYQINMVEEVGEQYIIDFVLRSKEQDVETVSVNIKYTTDSIPFEITKGNVLYDVNEQGETITKIILMDKNKSLADILGLKDSELKNVVTNTKKYSYNVEIQGFSADKFKLGYEENLPGFGNCAYLYADGKLENLPNSLTITVTDKRAKGSEVVKVTFEPTKSTTTEINLSTETSVDFGKEYSSEVERFKNVEYVQDENKIDLTSLLDYKDDEGIHKYTISKMAFGNEEYSFNYSDGTWNIAKQPSEGLINIEENAYLVVDQSIKEDFLQAFKEFVVVYNIKAIEMTGITQKSLEENGISVEFNAKQMPGITVSENGGFTCDWEYIVKNGEGSNAQEFYGLKFYEYNSVKVPVAPSKISITKELSGILKVEYANNDTYMRQGRFRIGGSEFDDIKNLNDATKLTFIHSSNFSIEGMEEIEAKDAEFEKEYGSLDEMKHKLTSDTIEQTFSWSKGLFQPETFSQNERTQELLAKLFNDEEITQVTTSQIITSKDDSTGINWEYILYSNGLIGVSKVSFIETEQSGTITINGHEINLDKNHKAFIRKIKEGFFYLYNPAENKVYNFSIVTNADETTTPWALSMSSKEKNDEENDIIVETYVKDLVNDYDFVLAEDEEQNITISDFMAQEENFSTIVADVDEKNIYFVKYNSKNYYITEVSGYDSEIYTPSFEISVGKDFNEAIADACKEAEFKYLEIQRDGEEWIIIEDNNWGDFNTGIPEGEWSQGFNIKYSCSNAVPDTDITVKPEDDNGNKLNYDIECIVLTGDVHLNCSVNKNDKTFVGNEHILKFAPQNGTLFKAQDVKQKLQFRDATFINIVAPTSLDKGEMYAPFASENLNINISNIKVYGTIRDIKGKLDSKVYSFVNTDWKDFEINGIKNYTTIYGAECENKQNITIIDNISGSESILIAGNGKKGTKGVDGTYDAYSLSERKGKAVDDFGQGGKIEVAKEFKGKKRVGQSGLVGFGGNGVNGWMVVDDANLIDDSALSGGAAGKVVANKDTDTNIEKNDLKSRTYNTIQLDGCGGIGAFGRVVQHYDDFKFYRAGLSNCTTNQNGEESVIWLANSGTDSRDERFYFGFASKISTQFSYYTNRNDEKTIFVPTDCKDSASDKSKYAKFWSERIIASLGTYGGFREGDEFYIFIHSTKNVGFGWRWFAHYISNPDYHTTMIWPANGNFLCPEGASVP